MKSLFVLLTLISASAFAAPSKSVIDKNLTAQLKNTQSVEVLDLDRKYLHYVACTLHPDICFSGIKSYAGELRIKTTNLGDLDFDCDVDHWTKKSEIVIKDCSPQGHHHEFKKLSKEGKDLIIIKDN